MGELTTVGSLHITMRRISRLDRSLVRLSSNPRTLSPFACPSCRQSPAFSTSAAQAAEPYTEKIRKKIWGTDSPPGDKDPYGGPSAYEKKRAEAAPIEESAPAQGPARQVEVAAKKPEPKKKTKERRLKKDRPANVPYDPSYVPAEDAFGLQEIGGYEPVEEVYLTGFTPEQRDNDPYETVTSLHRAVVEVFTIRRAGLPMTQLYNGINEADLTGDVDLVASPSGEGAEFRFLNGATEQDVLQSLLNPEPTESEQDVDADRSSEDPLADTEKTPVKENPTESEEDVAADRSDEDPLADTHKSERAASLEAKILSWSSTWRDIPLTDPGIKFSIMKRFLQLTGTRIGDSTLTKADSIGKLLNHLVVPPKADKLYDKLLQNGLLTELPNVKLSPKRITPIDKEKAVGRWKLIEAELVARGLPVTGHGPRP